MGVKNMTRLGGKDHCIRCNRWLGSEQKYFEPADRRGQHQRGPYCLQCHADNVQSRLEDDGKEEQGQGEAG